MRSSVVLVLLALVGTACPSGTNPDAPEPVEPFPITLPAGQACSDTISVPEVEDTTHVTDETQFNHNTDPPTSGRHFPEWITPTGVYDEPLRDGNTVHNLEHGHVYVQYNDVTDEERAEILAPVEAEPIMTLAAPRPEMPWKLAVTSWTRILVCAEIPPDVTAVVENFIEANRDSGVAPESVA